MPKNPARKVLDTETKIEYPSRYAAGKALAHLVGGDPTDHYVWFKILAEFPERFVDVETGEIIVPTKPKAKAETKVPEEGEAKAEAEDTEEGGGEVTKEDESKGEEKAEDTEEDE